MNMTKLIFYNNRFCPFAHRTAFTLLEKGAQFQEVQIPLSIELIKAESGVFTQLWNNGYNYEDLQKIKDDYKSQVNPSGEVPCLKYNDDIIFESDICSDFVESLFTGQGNQLVPSDLVQRANMQFAIKKSNDIIIPLYDLLKNQNAEADQQKADVLTQKIKIFAYLIKGPYVLGETFSMADIHIGTFFARFRHVMLYWRGYDILLENDECGTKLKQWITSIEQRDSFQKTTMDPQALNDIYEIYAQVKRTV